MIRIRVGFVVDLVAGLVGALELRCTSVAGSWSLCRGGSLDMDRERSRFLVGNGDFDLDLPLSSPLLYGSDSHPDSGLRGRDLVLWSVLRSRSLPGVWGRLLAGRMCCLILVFLS